MAAVGHCSTSTHPFSRFMSSRCDAVSLSISCLQAPMDVLRYEPHICASASVFCVWDAAFCFLVKE